MDVQKKGIITMLCNALTESCHPISEDFDWNALNSDPTQYKNLRGLLIRGATLAGIPRNHPALREMLFGFMEDIRRSRNQMQQLQEVYKAFDLHGVDYMPVKGAVLKNLYPQPELRMMEDADILIREEQLPALRQIMINMGMEERAGDINESIWNHPKLLVELHKTLISSQFGEFLDYLQNSWDFAEKEPTGFAYRFREEAHFIFLIIHFAKHYMHGNISPKDVCDLWVFRNAYPELDESYIETILKKIKIFDFYKNILSVLDSWFKGAEFSFEAELITEVVFRRGIADDAVSHWSYSIISRQDSVNSLKKAKLMLVIQKICPPLYIMQVHYPILLKKPLLIPLYYVKRWFDVIFLQKRLRTAVDVLIKEDALKTYREHLDKVGLRKITRD